MYAPAPVLPAPGPADAHHGVRISAVGLRTTYANGVSALHDVTVTIEPAALTAIVGPSGAGKSTLLAALAEIAPAQRGTVTLHRPGARVGFVPQDDILHGELPLRRTLRYAAALRLRAPTAAMYAAVDEAMSTLGLDGHGDVPVRKLSGGQRKRASLACEILTRPEVCALDEPTSGLDPAAAADLVACLRRMVTAGSTVVFTTHNIEDILRSDQVVVLAPGGRLVATGTPEEVLARTGAASFTELYEQLARDVRARGTRPPETGPTPPRRPRNRPRGQGPSAGRQWAVLTRRSAEIITRNRLTLAILLGSPAAVIAMFAVLFQPGGFDPNGVDATAAVQVAYWLAFAGFFFGLTFGLLQVCTEVPVLRGEHHAGVRIGAYLCSKLALLAPFLLVVNGVMIAVLGALDRIPDLHAGALAELFVTMAVNAIAALCLGLLASAAVNTTAQAALALPMLCFPAVLFAGAMVPVPVMATAGRAIAALMPDRWAFEAIAGQLDVAMLVGPASPHAALGASGTGTYWALLAGFATVLGAAAYGAVRRRATDRPR